MDTRVHPQFLRGLVPISWPENVTFILDDDDCFVLCLIFGGVFVAQLLSFLSLFSFWAIVHDTWCDCTKLCFMSGLLHELTASQLVATDTGTHNRLHLI
jgi:hypothetical protein